jgi:hypothetical protein
LENILVDVEIRDPVYLRLQRSVINNKKYPLEYTQYTIEYVKSSGQGKKYYYYKLIELVDEIVDIVYRSYLLGYRKEINVGPEISKIRDEYPIELVLKIAY